MQDNNEIHHRHSIRLPDYDYSQPGAYFVTVCVYHRECLFGTIQKGEMILNEYGKIASQFWRELPDHYKNIELDEFVIMPNHVHGIIMIAEDDAVGAIHACPGQKSEQARELPLHERRKMLIPKIMGRFKMQTAKQINILRNAAGTPIWQCNYYDHILRNDFELNEKREYIINNPLMWDTDEENRKIKPVQFTLAE